MRNLPIFIIVPLLAAALAALPAPAISQQPGSAVQLPTYSYFGAGTTVVVPDRGSASLGGVNRAATGRNEFRAPLPPFRNRAIGTERSAMSTRASVFIHDFDAIDEALLGQPTAGRRLQPRASIARQPIARQAIVQQPFAQRGVTRRPTPTESSPIWRQITAARLEASSAAKSVAQLRAERLRLEASRQEEAREWFERGRKAETAGKAGVARVYYQRAARRAKGALKQEVAARLDAVNSSNAPGAPGIAQREPSAG